MVTVNEGENSIHHRVGILPTKVDKGVCEALLKQQVT
jgi:hypothetical protein